MRQVHSHFQSEFIKLRSLVSRFSSSSTMSFPSVSVYVCVLSAHLLYLAFNNVLQKAVPVQDATISFSLPSFLYYAGCSFRPCFYIVLVLLYFSPDRSN